jgi:flagellar P-ring protein FlgI
VERDVSVDLSHLTHVSLLLREADFAVARDAAISINRELGVEAAHAIDGSRVEVATVGLAGSGIPTFLARIGDVLVSVAPVAKVVINERTGTIVLGSDVSLGSCSILQGSLSVDITTTFEVSQPAPFSMKGETVVVPQTAVEAKESPAQQVRLKEGATVEDLVRGLQAIGASARDIIAILQAIKAAGALQADVEII